MKLLPATALTFAAFTLLTACGQKAGGAVGSSAATSGPDVEVKMADLPHPRAGLWKVVMDNGDGKPATSTFCRSGKETAMPKMPAGCSQFSIKKTFLGAYVMDMTCKTPDYSMTAHANVTGDFQTHATGDSTMTMAATGKPPQSMKMHTDETWVGPCAPGQTPDDMGEKSPG